MVGELVEGKTYKVRLRPLEELEQEVDTVGRLGEVWFKDYVDGQVGVLHYGEEKPEWDTYMVRWEGDFWYYRLGCLKVLGEL